MLNICIEIDLERSLNYYIFLVGTTLKLMTLTARSTVISTRILLCSLNDMVPWGVATAPPTPVSASCSRQFSV